MNLPTFRRLLAAGLLAVAGSGPLIADEAPGPFRAGAATSNISPWMGLSLNGGMRDRLTTHVHDELHARALVLDDGRTKLALIVCDSCMIPRDVVQTAKVRIEELTGIPPDHVLVSATHAHSCPTSSGVFQSDPDEDYPRFLAARIADAAARAVNNLAPARIGWGVGENDRAGLQPPLVHEGGHGPARPLRAVDRHGEDEPAGR